MEERNQNSNSYESNPYNENPYGSASNAGAYDNPYNNPYYDSPYGATDTSYSRGGAVSGAQMDERVRAILTKSFLYMFIALCLSAMSAEAVNYCLRFGIIPLTSYVSLMRVIMLVELVFVIVGDVFLSKGNIKLGGLMLVVYSLLNGVVLSSVLLVYGSTTVTSTFISTALVFGAMAFIGIVSKKDFGVMGNIGLMLLFGIIIISTINLLIMKSSGVDLFVSVLGLLIFIGLTAYDTQKIKKMAMMYSGGENTDTAIAMSGALQLYLDFINIFLRLLRLLGKRSR